MSVITLPVHFQCNLCQLVGTSDKLLYHLESHHSVNRDSLFYKALENLSEWFQNCHFCDQSFTTMSEYIAHLTLVHKLRDATISKMVGSLHDPPELLREMVSRQVPLALTLTEASGRLIYCIIIF